MKKCVAAAAGLVSLFSLPAPVAAQAPGKDIVANTRNVVAYVIDQRGVVARSGTGLCWRTGYWTPALAIAECDPDYAPKPAPEPVAAAPAAMPAAAAPAPTPAPAPKKCDFSASLAADETFAFNSAKLSDAAKGKIDSEVVPKLADCATVKLILVTGHTDRLGSQSYNQKLSERRAEAVRAYLASKGASADAMEILGAGKTQPVPGVKCPDTLKRKALIACLAPNRRVTIDVKGMAK